VEFSGKAVDFGVNWFRFGTKRSLVRIQSARLSVTLRPKHFLFTPVRAGRGSE
jgi:hypothetical protein